MLEIKCNRLLINDTDIAEEDIIECLGAAKKTFGIEVLSAKKIGDEVRSKADILIDESQKILLPGRSARIFIDSVGISLPESKVIRLPSVRRKLDGLTPRGIEIDQRDSEVLEGLNNSGNVLIIDDVVASGSTINGISKRMGRRDIDILSLVSRVPTELQQSLQSRLTPGCMVEPLTQRIPAINTLSSLQDREKEGILLAGFRKLYGEQFSARISALFPIL